MSFTSPNKLFKTNSNTDYIELPSYHRMIQNQKPSHISFNPSINQPPASLSVPSSHQISSNIIFETHICPHCKNIATSKYESTTATFMCSLFLVIGLVCWVPFVTDGCKKQTLYCDVCQKDIAVEDATCCGW